jgi:hypothetical protein
MLASWQVPPFNDRGPVKVNHMSPDVARILHAKRGLVERAAPCEYDDTWSVDVRRPKS